MIKSYTLLALFCISSAVQSQKKNHNLIIGTYTGSCQSDGIYVYNFNSETAGFEFKSSTKNSINPSFLSLSPDKNFIYAVNENGNKSEVSSFKYYPVSGNLDFLNARNSKGDDPCHIIDDNKNCIVSNYTGGNVAVFAKESDGSLSESRQVLEFTTNEVDRRQPVSHLHEAVFSPDRKFILFTDLGTDCIYVYKYHPERETEILEKFKLVKIKPGSGPRHLVFSKNGKFAYLIRELDGGISVFGFKEGALTPIQETNLIAMGFKGETSAAEILISKDGKYLYATNRGTANTISCFKINKDGKINLLQTQSTLGKGPRNFAIDPSGSFLLIGHQYTNDIIVFKINKKTGMLTDTGKKLELCSPVCLVFD